MSARLILNNRKWRPACRIRPSYTIVFLVLVSIFGFNGRTRWHENQKLFCRCRFPFSGSEWRQILKLSCMLVSIFGFRITEKLSCISIFGFRMAETDGHENMNLSCMLVSIFGFRA